MPALCLGTFLVVWIMLAIAPHDRTTWALENTPTLVGVPVAVERSRSGNGAHVWVFFAEPIVAAEARRLAFAVRRTLITRRSLPVTTRSTSSAAAARSRCWKRHRSSC